MKEIPVFDVQGNKQGVVTLSGDSVEKKRNDKAYAVAIHVDRQNARQGTVSCKSRSEVCFSNRKPWKQKGTGRARAGSARSPLWRKGGVIFGPQPRVRTLRMPRNQRQLVLNNLLYERIEHKAIHRCDFVLEGDTPSTKHAQHFLKKAGLLSKKIILFLPVTDTSMSLSFRNIPWVRIVYFDQPNAYDLSSCLSWVYLKKDEQLFKEMVEKWN